MQQLAPLSPQDPLGSHETYAMPATQAQERFWSLDQLNPGNPGLNMPMMWECRGHLDLSLLREAFDLTIERHESLRTTFEVIDGRLNQIVGLPYSIQLPVVSLEHLPNAATSKDAARHTMEHAAYRMNLLAGPLLSLKLLRFDQTHHMLLVTMHHIICDGMSLGIVLRDVAAYYEALVEHQQANLPVLPIQFADFAIWQQEWRGSEEHRTSLDYWRSTLGNRFSKVNLPTDAPVITPFGNKEALETKPAGDIETLLLPADLTARAHQFCMRESITLNVLLMSVFSALLSRLTGQQDLLIGSPNANRTAETQDSIGLFMNIQVLRVRLEGRSTFASLLQQVNTWALGATANQQLPFEELVHDPYFAVGENAFELPVFFLYQRSFMVAYKIGDLEIVPLRSMSPGAVFEIMFAVVNRENEGTRLQFEYNPLRFRSETVRHYLGLYVALLESALREPQAAVEELSLRDFVETGKLLPAKVPYGSRPRQKPPAESILAAVYRQARDKPGRTAIECGASVWSYDRLVDYATRMSQRLARAGFQVQQRVAICLEPSPELLGSVLGVLQSGGVCILVDSALPMEQLLTILSDSRAAVVLSASTLEIPTHAEVMQLNTSSEDLTGTANPDGRSSLTKVLRPFSAAATWPAFIAYLPEIGSQPKGVEIDHGTLLNALVAAAQATSLTEADAFVGTAASGSNLAILELLLPVMRGMRIILPTLQQLHNPELLVSLIDGSSATALGATSEVLQALSDAGWTTGNRTSFKVLCDCDAIPSSFHPATGGAEVLSIWSCSYAPQAMLLTPLSMSSQLPGRLSIQVPLARPSVYLLDARMQMVPDGVAGDLYIGGDLLARGYWNNQELTDASFILNPYAPGRLFRSGWRARRAVAKLHDEEWRSIELLGRIDRQVLIEGRRVDLRGVENVLRLHPVVKDSAVLYASFNHAPGMAGQRRLVAFVTMREGTVFADVEHELRQSITLKVPGYAVPNLIVPLRELPVDRHGQVDRGAFLFDSSLLESLSEANARDLPLAQTSRDPIEWQLVEIWQATLGIPQISVDDSFFSLGVGSLAALRLITRMNRVYSTDLGLATLFAASTIRAIAEKIRSRVAPNTRQSVVAIQPHGTRTPLFIVHGVGGNVVSFYGLAMHLGTDQPVYGVQSQALLLDEPALIDLRDMAAYYLQEIRKVQPEGPYNLLGYSFGGSVVLEMAHQLRAAGQEVAMLGMLDSKSSQYSQAYRKAIAAEKKESSGIRSLMDTSTGMSGSERLNFFLDKIKGRLVRVVCNVAATLHLKTVPSFLKDAYEVNFVAASNYIPQPYDGRMTLFRASRQAYRSAPEDLGWGSIFMRGVEIHMLPGDHERIFAEQNIEALASRINGSLRSY